jgi:hypothetical protein
MTAVVMDNKPAPHPILGTCEPDLVLFEHDAIIVFTFMNAGKQLCLGYLAQATSGSPTVYLVTAIEPDRLQAVRNGQLPIRDCFDGPCWQVKVILGGTIEECVPKTPSEVEALLPPPELRVHVPSTEHRP